MGRTRTASIDRRGDAHRVRIAVAGTRYTFTLRTTSRRAAERFALAKIQELEREAERRTLGLPTAIRFSALLALVEREEFATLAPGTQAAYEDSLKAIRRYFHDELHDPRIDHIAAKHITGFLCWRRVHRLNGGAPLHGRTLQKDRAVLHRIFAYADRLELRDGNPVARTAVPKADARDPVILSAAQYEQLLAACDMDDAGQPAPRPMLRLYVLVLGEAGVRCESEALWLRWEHVDLEQGFLWIAQDQRRRWPAAERHRTKSGKGRWVPLTPRLREAMRGHFAAYRFAGSPWVFYHVRTRRRHQVGARIQSLRTAFTAAATRAKLPEELHQHDLRHRRVTTWLAEGQNPAIVQDAMGHASVTITTRYKHLAKEHLRVLVEKVPPARRRRRTTETA